MVKGISRRVVVLDSPDQRFFEQAIFIVRPLCRCSVVVCVCSELNRSLNRQIKQFRLAEQFFQQRYTFCKINAFMNSTISLVFPSLTAILSIT